mmetsp:Transcript_25419/g.71284  ORF Transcript_25419/g.71284 Transcript_25419/m.71284 type:complete len:385 (+) Transcript_25419:40-1194(+)
MATQNGLEIVSCSACSTLRGVTARGGDVILIGEENLRRVVPEIRNIKCGVLFLQSARSDCALSLNENCDSAVRRDMWRIFEKLSECDGDVAALLARSPLAIPVSNGKLVTGTWQGVYAICHAGCGPLKISSLLVRSLVPGPGRVVVDAGKRGVADVSSAVKPAVGDATEGGDAVVVALLLHTSASVTVDAQGEGLEEDLSRVVPESWNSFLEHTYEGDDDMPGHAKSTLVGANTIIVGSSTRRLWLCEHRNVGGWGGGHQRKIALRVVYTSPGRRVRSVDGKAARGCVDISGVVRAAAGDAPAVLVCPVDPGTTVTQTGLASGRMSEALQALWARTGVTSGVVGPALVGDYVMVWKDAARSDNIIWTNFTAAPLVPEVHVIPFA